MMMNSLRLVGFGLFLMGLTAVFPVGVSAQVSSPDTMYACVRLDRDAHKGPSIRIVAADQACRPNETRMLLVASKKLLFFAHAAPPAVTDRSAGLVDPAFVSKIIPTIVSVPASAPLFIAVTLQVDTDNGMYTIPHPSAVGGRGMSSSVSCAPLVDGQQAGSPERLSSNAGAVGQGSVSGMVDPRTGRFEELSPGYFPETLWSILREYHDASAGRHEVAVACEAHAAFRFRGLATLTVLQQAQ